MPNVRWPGGCFADEYHWRKGIGPASARPATLNPNWGGVIEPNTFGTHEFLDFAGQIGAEAYLSINVGSGTPAEAADWLEYLTAAQPTALAKDVPQRHAAPYKIASSASSKRPGTAAATCRVYYLASCAGTAGFARNFILLSEERPMLKIAVGPGGGEPRLPLD